MFKFAGFGLALALCVGTGVANAQSFDAFFGAGTAMDSSSNSSINTYGNGTYFNTPSMGGAFGKAGVDFFFKPQFGVNAETDFRFSQGDYAGLTYRPTFYDFNFVFKPMAGRFHHIEPIIQAGVGGMNLKFYENGSYCDAFAGCSSSTQYLESSNHFQVHIAAGIRMYATHHIFIQPQVDAHYVNNLFQFGDNWVPEYGAVVGYSFGER
jgi:outer membrane protein W